MFVLRKSNANSKPIIFLATDAKARAPSCFLIPNSGDRVMFKYLYRKRTNDFIISLSFTITTILNYSMATAQNYGITFVETYLDNSHGFCVHPIAVKSVSRSDADVVSRYCL